MFPDDSQVFPFEKIESERRSSIAPVQIRPDDDRHQTKMKEVKTNPGCSWFKEDLGKTFRNGFM